MADALFANHDVAGMSYDNIFIAGGKPYRIDNGGGLLFRAQGAPKQNFGTEVLELVSMRDKKYSKPNSKIFANITDDKINQQIRPFWTASRGYLVWSMTRRCGVRWRPGLITLRLGYPSGRGHHGPGV